MSLIIPPGFLQAVYTFQLLDDTEPIVTTLGHEIDTASGASGAQAADDLFVGFATHIMPELNNRYILTGVDAYVGQDGPGPLVYTSTEAPENGGATAAPLPQNCAYLIRKRTDLAGRRGRGRMYIPGCREDQVDPTGLVASGMVTALQTAFDNFYEYLTAAVGGRYYPPVVLHRSEGAGVEPPPTPITTFTAENRIATQRRRLRP